MKKILLLSAILVCVSAVFCPSVTAQSGGVNNVQAAGNSADHYELATNFSYKVAKIAGTTTDFLLPGVAVDGAYKFNGKPDGIALAIDLNGERATAIEPGVNLSQFSLVAGPRYYFSFNKQSTHALTFYAQALVGFDAAYNSVFPGSSGTRTSATSAAFQAGGGANLRLSRHISLRLAEADFVTTSLPNFTNNRQYDVRFSNGLVFRF
jgi:hypothetical protein